MYWRLVQDTPAGWIPDNFHTIWRTATIKAHIFSEDIATASTVGRDLIAQLYADKRLIREGESPIMVNQRNALDNGADPLRTGQVTVEATYGIIIYKKQSETISKINY